MRIIGVIDLLGGRAVHAKGGCRHDYGPVHEVAGTPVGGDAALLARLYLEELQVSELYVADLDAIAGGAEQDQLVRRIAETGVPVWLDAGVSTVAQARRAHTRGATHVVIGLETLTSFAVLTEIAMALGSLATAFSLDLRNGRPISRDPAAGDLSPAAIARRGADAGAGAVIVLDLARVGSETGLDVTLLAAVRRAVPDVTLLAGGGVRGEDDLQALLSVGCDGVLVATALHGTGGAALVRSMAGRRAGHGNVTR
jgi:phosphoribosylformimino-5-aminoimidazole carboxamide ribotide isomerase